VVGSPHRPEPPARSGFSSAPPLPSDPSLAAQYHPPPAAGLLALFVNADGSLALTLKLDCYYALRADARVLVQGTILDQPLDLALRVGPIDDGGLVSCVTATLTTAVPVAGCLLSQLLPTINLDLPLNLVLGKDMSGCSGVLPALGGGRPPALALLPCWGIAAAALLELQAVAILRLAAGSAPALRQLLVPAWQQLTARSLPCPPPPCPAPQARSWRRWAST
jgi:hypothetical protein